MVLLASRLQRNHQAQRRQRNRIDQRGIRASSCARAPIRRDQRELQQWQRRSPPDRCRKPWRVDQRPRRPLCVEYEQLPQ